MQRAFASCTNLKLLKSRVRAVSSQGRSVMSTPPGKIACVRPSSLAALPRATQVRAGHGAPLLRRRDLAVAGQPGSGSTRRQRAIIAPRAMVNVDVSPSVILGVGLIGAGVSLWQIRQARPWISKDYDVVISCISLLVGGILIFQGWRLDPLLLFGQLMTTGAAVSFAVEALRLRSEVYEQEEKAALQDVFKRKGPGGPGGAAFQLPPPEAGQARGGSWEDARRWGGGYDDADELGPPGFYDYQAAEQLQQQQRSGAYAGGAAGARQQYEQQQGGYYYDEAPPGDARYDAQQYDDGGGAGPPFVQADYYDPAPGDAGYYSGEAQGLGPDAVEESTFPSADVGGDFGGAKLGDAEDWE